MSEQSSREEQTGAGGEWVAQRRTPLTVFAWLWVGLPFAYGVVELVRKVVQLFGG
jgi:hypothetical protein